MAHPPFLHLVALCAFALCGIAKAGPITVPNGDFSSPSNQGSIGGGVIGGSGSAAIGSGPWSGAYFGALGLLAPPTLTIGGGKATSGGLLGVTALGIVNNGGSFQQDTSTPWQPNKRYTLSADITTSGALDLNLLQAGNAGVALARGATRLASSTTSGTVTLNLLSGSTYRLTMTHDTGASVSGNIGIHLFTEPSGLLSANLLGSVSYSNVTLSSRLLNQVPAALAADTSPRSGAVATAVAPPLEIRVLDADGDPIEGVSVTFSVPASGPSATVTPNPALTDANGIAHVTTTANTIAGSYAITATVAGLAAPIVFPMVNLPGPAAAVSGASGNGQAAEVGSAFTTPLSVKVADAYGNAVPGTPVTFAGPASGAGAVLPAAPVTTDAAGMAQATPSANTVAGSYQVSASVAGVATPATFALTNLLQPSVTPEGPGEPSQNGEMNGMFACALLVRVTDGGVPRPGLLVDFVAPVGGPSATLSNGTSSGSTVRTSTDDDGLAWAEATANAEPGDYTVKAWLLYSLAAPVEFHLRNLAVNDPLFATGFDGACMPTSGPVAVDVGGAGRQ
ncbi:MAG: hypothetical protein GXC76_11455 [Rhodanobacteraceae bacterium]|jgi:hypothetical protein|nr:hypothetical protein [Rhodanobacteraceae bacterium]